MALAAKVSSCRLHAGAVTLPARTSMPARLVAARAQGPKVSEGRTFREDDGSLTGPGEAAPTKQADGAMYVDDAPRQQRPKKASNLSPEMRARLKQEYVGLGGAENSAAGFAPRRPVVAAVTLQKTTTAAASFSARPDGTTMVSEASTSSPSASEGSSQLTAVAKQGASKWVIDENENLKSTNEHRAWTWGTISMIGAQLAVAWSHVASSADAVTFGGMVFLAYILSDFATGVYHWGVDNYGDGTTPVFGRQIAAFQGHHQRPWTITQREFCNNVHQVFKPAAPAAALLLVASPFLPMAWNAWSSTFLFLVCMSQQFHAWSHMKKSELHPAVVLLQDAGLLIGRRMHGAHHRSPFNENYCIVSGLCNPAMDRSGMFLAMEKAVLAATGVEPRGWYEPEYDWKEQERPGSSSSAEQSA